MHMTSSSEIVDLFRDLVGKGDLPWALRQLSEYTTGVCRGTWELIASPPQTGDSNWDTALAALTCWAAQQTAQATPLWAEDTPPLVEPWAPLQSYRHVGPYMLQRWRRDTPGAIASKGVIFAGRELVNP